MLLLGACTGVEEPAATPLSEPGEIRVCAGAPSLALGSRSPAIDGVCNADKLEVMVYKHTRNPFTPSELDLHEDATMDLEANNADNDRKRAHTVAQIQETGSTTQHFILGRALAYTAAEAGWFTKAVSSEPSTNTGTITLQKTGDTYRTPELYFGFIDFTSSQVSMARHGSEPFAYEQWTGAVSVALRKVTPSAKGNIYRIVSQFNLELTEIPENVTGITLRAARIPLSVSLAPASGAQGTFYPVGASTTATPEGEYFTLGEATPADGTCRFSALLLPGTIPTDMQIEVHYTTGQTKRYEVRPTQTQLAADGLRDVYTGATEDQKHDATHLVIYQNSADAPGFYSYANLKTNVRGKFTKVAYDRTRIDCTVEVEPYFVATHNITLK